MNDLLFVYGSLLSTGNYFAEYLTKNAQLIGTGSFKGTLYDIGEYPGAVIHQDNQHTITGSIFRLENPKIGLALLDDYEGFGPEQEQPNLFTRQLLLAETPGDPVECWVYLYDRPVENLQVVTSGDYQAYLKTKP